MTMAILCVRRTCVPPGVQWTAPEVRAGSEAAGRVTTVESDVYMVGGLGYELLTGGTTPFHWLLGNPHLLAQRLVSAVPVEIPDCPPVPGLLRLNVLEALAAAKRAVPWCVQADGTPGSAGRLEELKGVVGECLAGEPGVRPKLPALLSTLEDLEQREVAEAREVGSPGGGSSGVTTPASAGPVSSVLPPPLPVSTTSPSSATAGHSSPAGVCGWWAFVRVLWRFLVADAWCLVPVSLCAAAGLPGASFKRGDVLDALDAVGVSPDLQDAVARGLAGCRVIAGDRLAAVLHQAGVPERLALRVEDHLVRAACGILRARVDVTGS